ncbi:MAG: NnrS family protein [Xanthobacteraceae bacterium]|nr:NnrS family protein [Xanthobacteraceae bacterium]
MSMLSLRRPRGLAAVPLLGYGFRPFFLAAALWAPLAMLLWIAAFTGQTARLAVYGATAWHAHELLFGYLAATLAGFLLTASANWTGRPPLQGGILLALALLWLAGRLALLAAAEIGIATAALVESLFLVALALLVGREIVAARNWRNLRIVALVAALAAANLAYHAEVVRTGQADVAARVALALILVLLMVIGGRITPSFTRNWLIAQGAARMPALFGRLDTAAIAVGGTALALWALGPEQPLAAGLLLAAAALHVVRLARWHGARTWREPIVLVLHVGYGFVPLGFGLAALAAVRPDLLAPDAALHAWTAGAIGVMTLAVMTRVSLGHTGRAVTASRATVAIYAAVVLAALLRIAAPLSALALPLLVASGLLWVAAFLGFLVCYGPILVRARAPGPASC